MHHPFFVHFLPSFLDYNVKVPKFRFCRGWEHISFLFLNFDTVL